MLVCYARELKEAFSDYTEEVVNLMVPLLKFYFHDGVRTAAVESLPYLLECARVKGPQYVQVKYIHEEKKSAIKFFFILNFIFVNRICGTSCVETF